MRKINYELDRSQCSRVELSYPGMGKNERSFWIEEKLEGLYPKGIENLIWDYRLNKGIIVLYYTERKTIAEIEKVPGKYKYHYMGEKERIFKSSSLPQQSKEVLIFSLSLIILFCILIIHPLIQKSKWDDKLGKLNREIAMEEKSSSENIELKEKIDSFNMKLSLLEESAPPDLYERISRLTPYFDEQFRIISLTVTDNQLQCQAMGKNPLLLIDEMKGDDNFIGIEIEKTDVDTREGYELFTWKGRFSD